MKVTTMRKMMLYNRGDGHKVSQIRPLMRVTTITMGNTMTRKLMMKVDRGILSMHFTRTMLMMRRWVEIVYVRFNNNIKERTRIRLCRSPQPEAVLRWQLTG